MNLINEKPILIHQLKNDKVSESSVQDIVKKYLKLKSTYHENVKLLTTSKLELKHLNIDLG